MEPLENIELIRGEISDYKFGNDGILYSYQKNIKPTLKSVQENHNLIKKITNGSRVPILRFSSKNYYVKKSISALIISQYPINCTAMAIYNKSRFLTIASNIFYNTSNFNGILRLPVKFFSNEDKAIEWLKEYRD
jgi:hypothetical protein